MIKERKTAKKVKKRKFPKKFIKAIWIIGGLVVLSGVIYSLVYYGLIDYIKDLLIIYYPYILMGIGILVILILILHFHAKKIL